MPPLLAGRSVAARRGEPALATASDPVVRTSAPTASAAPVIEELPRTVADQILTAILVLIFVVWAGRGTNNLSFSFADAGTVLVVVAVGIGVDVAVATPAVLIYRLVTYWAVMLPGWISLEVMKKHGEV
jgi:hypothetical protein